MAQVLGALAIVRTVAGSNLVAGNFFLKKMTVIVIVTAHGPNFILVKQHVEYYVA